MANNIACVRATPSLPSFLREKEQLKFKRGAEQSNDQNNVPSLGSLIARANVAGKRKGCLPHTSTPTPLSRGN